jgi:hypothetical protein
MVCKSKKRIPGESRDPLVGCRGADEWIPAFAGNAKWSGANSTEMRVAPQTHTRSMTAAMPWPTPTHIETSA